MARSVALSFAVLLAVFEIGSCLRCYQCNSESDPYCRDPFQAGSRNFVDCFTQDAVNYNKAYLSHIFEPRMLESPAGATRQCAKIDLQTGATIRTCLDVNSLVPDQICDALQRSTSEFRDPGRQIRHCSICSTELCNGAGSATFSLPLATLALIASYLYYKQ
ncbi:uncharacterized protein LOC113231254 [Hyposmocoma kahamanoa]|uniref:uncharacterized protein LOC113231254 n=1 Tax=Hyposmocoma kahamanoa TaxID=1477025 RepID=UPI000E6D7243|nr:uncharacterized protein LOC113231254 [Hyposmocoma kahamanoa]